ncbi:hypothetical protein N7478_007026 [Penicillium angulare]|uniref:uncharacterized protein n=1 Tax=Penicillium angulare TaxID=116970 RepID=UPI002541935A|nr:uncharacterized protein N7478_007026 [Penicillium angulare]KAJ5281654.1 hypothetical protein N7478_007026 [Penicillium angulare]
MLAMEDIFEIKNSAAIRAQLLRRVPPLVEVEIRLHEAPDPSVNTAESWAIPRQNVGNLVTKGKMMTLGYLQEEAHVRVSGR